MSLKVNPVRAAALAALCLCAACSQSPDAPPSGGASEPAAAPAERAPEGVSGPATVSGRVPIANGQPSVVVLQPQPQAAAAVPGTPAVMDQVALAFIPSMLLVRSGHPTEFWNSDDVLHNVRVSESDSRQGQFNVAIPQGEKYVHTFTREGFYDVGCDIHPTMTAQIFATTSPYAALTDSEGQYAIADVPPGTYTLVAYVGAEKLDRGVTVAGATTADIAKQ